MSMVQQLISAVTGAERQIDQYISSLNAYIGQIDEVTNRVNTAFSGSQKEYGQQMLQQLSVTKQEVNKTIERLQVAKDKLSRVRMI